jgi:obg-like ATPase 1
MKKLKEEQATVEKILEHLKAGKDVRKGDWSPKEVRTFHFWITSIHCHFSR